MDGVAVSQLARGPAGHPRYRPLLIQVELLRVCRSKLSYPVNTVPTTPAAAAAETLESTNYTRQTTTIRLNSLFRSLVPYRA